MVFQGVARLANGMCWFPNIPSPAAAFRPHSRRGRTTFAKRLRAGPSAFIASRRFTVKMGSRMFITDQWLLSRIFNLAYIPFFGNCFSAVSPAAQAGAFIETVYNVDRLHSALGHKPPAEFEADLARSRKPRTKSRSRIVTELAVSHTRGAVQYLGLRAQCKSVTVLEYRNTLHPAHRLLNAERVEVLDGFILHSLIFGRRGIDACKDSEIRYGKVLLAHCLIYETTLEMCGQISPIEPQEDFKIAECAFEIPSQSPQPCALDEQRSVLRPYFQCLIKLGYRLGIVAFLGCGRGEQPGAQQARADIVRGLFQHFVDIAQSLIYISLLEPNLSPR